MRWVRPLDPAVADGPGDIGGKAHGLITLRRLGLPVPPGFVVTTGACRAFRRLGRLPDGLEAEVRTALAALDNAEAAPAPETPNATTNEHIAGSRSGVGSTEAPRRVLSADRVRALLNEQIEERIVEAGRYEAHGRHDAARRLRLEADALRPYV